MKLYRPTDTIGFCCKLAQSSMEIDTRRQQPLILPTMAHLANVDGVDLLSPGICSRPLGVHGTELFQVNAHGHQGICGVRCHRDGSPVLECLKENLSYMTTWWPCWRSARATAKPPIPAPTTSTFKGLPPSNEVLAPNRLKGV